MPLRSGREPSGAPWGGGPGHSAPDAGRGRRSALAPARAVPAPRPERRDPPARGEEREAPGPGPQGPPRRAAPGPARAHWRSGAGTTAPRQRPPHNGLALHAARRSPAARPPRESALTSGQRGAVVDRDPDLLHSALSQLQGHLHSLDSAALRPPRRIQTWGGEQPVDPRNKGEGGCVRGSAARELSRALLFGNVLCAKSRTLARGVRLHEPARGQGARAAPAAAAGPSSSTRETTGMLGAQ